MSWLDHVPPIRIRPARRQRHHHRHHHRHDLDDAVVGGLGALAAAVFLYTLGAMLWIYEVMIWFVVRFYIGLFLLGRMGWRRLAERRAATES